MDVISFKQLFLPCHQKLYQVAFRILGNSNDAEDIVQEAYLKLWTKRNELTDIKNPESFSVTVIKNLCFDFIRNSKDNMDNRTPEELNIQIDISIGKEIEYKDELSYIERLINQLPPQQQKVMRLCHINDYSLKEIEQATGLNSINVRTLLSRARKKIREQFEIVNKR